MTDPPAGTTVVVATAMPLSATARVELSDLLGPGYAVVDIKSAPRDTQIVLTPVVSAQLLGSLRGISFDARILYTELHDAARGISFDGPLSRIVAQGPDGYFVAHTLDALGRVVQSEARLQLAGSTQRTPLSLTWESPAPEPPEQTDVVVAPGEPLAAVLWVDRAATTAEPAGQWLDLAPVDDLVTRITGLEPAIRAELQVRVASERIDQATWPAPVSSARP